MLVPLTISATVWRSDKWPHSMQTRSSALECSTCCWVSVLQNTFLDFIEPGKPTQNGHLESFNGKFRDECLNLHWFTSLQHARQIIAAWKEDYNTLRPHSALHQQPPAIYAQTLFA
jgi:transposase InsO family protein